MPGAPEGAAFSQPASSWVCSPPSWNTCPAPAPPSPTILRDAGQEALRSPLRREPPTHPLQPAPPAHRNTRKKTETNKTRGCSSSDHHPTGAQGRTASPSSLHKAAERKHSLGIEGAPGHGLQVLGQRRGEPAQCQHDHSDQPLADPTLPRPGHLPRGRLHFRLRCAQSSPRLRALRWAPSGSSAHPLSSPASKRSPPVGSAAALLGRAGREHSPDGSPHPRPGPQPPRTGPCDL